MQLFFLTCLGLSSLPALFLISSFPCARARSKGYVGLPVKAWAPSAALLRAVFAAAGRPLAAVTQFDGSPPLPLSARCWRSAPAADRLLRRFLNGLSHRVMYCKAGGCCLHESMSGSAGSCMFLCRCRLNSIRAQKALYSRKHLKICPLRAPDRRPALGGSQK